MVTVPTARPASSGVTGDGTDAAPGGIAAAIALLAGRRTVVLTGAGLSTDSGIPDYRGPSSPRRSPMTIAEFRSGPAARQRYWARSHVGWARMRAALPNGGHHALARLQAAGAVTTIVTQNVDGLHQAAGSDPVVDLHGRLDTVVCLDCGARSSRLALQRWLSELNPGFGGDGNTGDGNIGDGAPGSGAPVATAAPDGDADIDDTAGFVVADCLQCGGVLKPDVVFFGENVPGDTVRRSYAAVDNAQAMLVAGSSLTVMSGLRFVKRAAAQQIPVVIVNHGATRGDGLADLVLDAGCTPTLRALADGLS